MCKSVSGLKYIEFQMHSIFIEWKRIKQRIIWPEIDETTGVPNPSSIGIHFHPTVRWIINRLYHRNRLIARIKGYNSRTKLYELYLTRFFPELDHPNREMKTISSTKSEIIEVRIPFHLNSSPSMSRESRFRIESGISPNL